MPRPAEQGPPPLPFRWPLGANPRESHPVLTSVAQMLAVLLFSLPDTIHTHSAWAWPLTVAMIVPLVWRTRAPELVFTVLVAITVVQFAADVPLTSDAALLMAFYSVVLVGSTRRIAAAAVVMEVIVVAAALDWAHTTWSLAIVLLTGTVTAAGVLALNRRTRRAYLFELRDRADRLERERDTQVQLAQAAERTRIAREMHDIVAHHVTVMITLAEGAAALARTQPGRAVEAMTTVATTGRQALSDTRGLLGVLRSEDADEVRQPQPDLAALDPLMQQLRAAGLTASLTVSGARPALSAGLQLTLFRIVQEALTNALKHGGPEAAAAVDIRYGPGSVGVTVTDDGLGSGAGAESPSGGNGLVGMRERVATYGGTLSAGPAPGGGWRVSVALPTTPAERSAEVR
jgi:signal transduction histidine kinase